MQVEIKRAEFVAQLDEWRSDARVYKLDPPHRYVDWNDDDQEKSLDYVIVSAVVAYSGPEVLIFPAKKVGDTFEPISMLEIAGHRGTMDHEEELRDLGYEV